jgi:hypothetical protein
VPNRTLPKALSLSRTKRLQLKLSQQRQQYPLLSNTILDDNDDDDDSEDPDYQRGYSRPKVHKVKETVTDFDDDEPLSDYVTVRLAVARAKAMLKYRENSVQA